MNKIFVTLVMFLSALLSGCAGMNMSAGGAGKNGAGFISADGRGMQRGGYPGYGGQPMMVQQGYPGVYGQPAVVQGYPQYGQPMPMYGTSSPMYYGGGYGGHGGGIQTAPCMPFQADALMSWAQGAGGTSTHSRSASVSNNNGRVNCYSSEGASSNSVVRPVAVPIPTAVPMVR